MRVVNVPVHIPFRFSIVVIALRGYLSSSPITFLDLSELVLDIFIAADRGLTFSLPSVAALSEDAVILRDEDEDEEEEANGMGSSKKTLNKGAIRLTRIR